MEHDQTIEIDALDTLDRYITSLSAASYHWDTTYTGEGRSEIFYPRTGARCYTLHASHPRGRRGVHDAGEAVPYACFRRRDV